MQRVIVRAIVALCTLSAGIAFSLLVRSYLKQLAPAGEIPAAALKTSGVTITPADLQVSRRSTRIRA